MSDHREDSSGVDSTTVGVYRTAATIKGGRRFSFGALVVVGDRHGQVGVGYAKANEVPPAIEKAEKDARRSMRKVSLKEGTIPHTVVGRFGASQVKLVPASPGTGVVAGGTVRAVLELAGVRDCLSKSYGSTNKKNLVKATLAGLEQLRSKEEIERLRGVELPDSHVEEILKRGAQYHTPVRAPRPVPAEAGPGGGGGGKGRGGGGGRGRGRGGPGGRGGGPGGGGGRGDRGPQPSATIQAEPEKVAPQVADSIVADTRPDDNPMEQ